MELIENVICSSIFIAFPLLFFFVFLSYNKALNIDEKKIFYLLVLCSVFYLLIKYDSVYLNMFPYILLDIPVIFAYTRSLKKEPIMISTLVIVGYLVFTDYSIIIIITTHILYYFMYLIKSKYKIDNYKFGIAIIIVSAFGLFASKTLFFADIIYLFIIAVFTYIITYYFINRIEKIVNYNNTIKELVKEEQFKSSLFKITHEIKNPLAVCKGYIDMFDAKDINKSDKYIKIIKGEIDKTLILLQDFLSMNKINIDKDYLDVDLLVTDILLSLKHLLAENGIVLEYTHEYDEVIVFGDYNRLNQVIINIIKNSMEAINGNGRIKVVLKKEKDNIKMVISDDGCGISQNDLLRIKEPFFTTKIKGTGLGVSMAYEIIEAHNGTIKYDSKKGIGTTVTIKLPIINDY